MKLSIKLNSNIFNKNVDNNYGNLKLNEVDKS